MQTNVPDEFSVEFFHRTFPKKAKKSQVFEIFPLSVIA